MVNDPESTYKVLLIHQSSAECQKKTGEDWESLQVQFSKLTDSYYHKTDFFFPLLFFVVSLAVSDSSL